MRFEFYMRLTYMQYDAVKPFKKLKMFFFFVGNDIWNASDLFFGIFFKHFPSKWVYAYKIFASSYCLSMILY